MFVTDRLKLNSEADRESVQQELEMLLVDYNEKLNVRFQEEIKIVMNAKSRLMDLEIELSKSSPREYYGGTIKGHKAI